MAVLDALLEGFDPHEVRGAHGRWIHGVGTEGGAARGRGASSIATEHADTRDKLTNLPVGQTYGLHGPRGQIGRVERTVSGWHVIGPTDTHDRLHKTPSSAAGHAMKLQRTASADGGDVMMRNYRHREEVRRMNERQARRSEEEADRQLEIRARMSSSSRDRALAQTELDRRRGARTPRLAVRESALDRLLEGFAAPAQDPFPDQPFTTGDQVRVSVGGGASSITGRVMRPHGGPPPTHAVVAPEGGGAHVLAPIGQVKLNTPAQHAAAQKRQERQQAKQDADAATAAWMASKPPNAKTPGAPAAGKPRVREGLDLVLGEAFVAGGSAAPGETPAQSMAIAARQAKQAQATLAAGWNASKHPRGQGGKFGYTTGGKRATRGPKSSSRTVGQGASGPLVKAIQRAVGVAADGQYGPNTKAAVMRFQHQHGLQQDGVVGAQTLAQLRGRNGRAVKPGPITSKQAKLRTHPAAKHVAPVKVAATRIGGGVVV